jgi:hypothetical protein
VARRRLSSKITAWYQSLGLDRWVREKLALFKACPLRNGGIALIAAVVTNRVMLWFMGRESTAFADIMRVVLLLLGGLALSIDSDWRMVRQGSLLMKLWERWRGCA